MSLPGKRRQHDWKQARELSWDYSLLKNKAKTPLLIALNELTSFSEEHWGFLTFPMLRQQKEWTDIQAFDTIRGQDLLTQAVQHLRLEGLKSSLVFLGNNCLTISHMLSRTDLFLCRHCQPLPNSVTGLWTHRKEIIPNWSQVKCMCVVGTGLKSSFSSYSGQWYA